MSLLSFAALRDLARTVKRGLPERGQYISRANYHDSHDLASRYFRALADSPEQTEQALAQEIFGTTPQDTRYKVHKTQMKERLLNSLFVLDVVGAGYSELTQRHLNNDRDAFLATRLLKIGPDPLAKSVAEHGLREALALEAWPNVMQFASVLREIAAFNGKEQERLKFSQEYFRAAEIELAEQHALDSYTAIVAAFATTGGEKYEVAEIAERALPDLEAAYQKHGTFGLALQRFRLRAAALQVRQKYRETLPLCDEFEALLEKKFRAFANPDRKFEVAHKRLFCQMKLGENVAARRTAAVCERLLPRGAEGWFYLQEEKFLIETHTGHFDAARRIYEATLGEKRFAVLPENRTERWNIFERHLDYAQGRIPAFRSVASLLEHLPVYSKDKLGFNASLILLQIVLLAERGDVKAMGQRIQALRQYREEMLGDEGNEQLFALFALLDSLGENLERIPKWLREVRPQIKAFRNIKAAPFDGVQILSYEWLWDRFEMALRRSNRKRTTSQ